MKRTFIALVILIFTISSCASSKKTANIVEPDFGLRLFYYDLTPDTKFIVLKEHDNISIANSILSSYNTDDLIDALSLAYLELPSSEQTYVNNAFKNTDTLPYTFQQALVIAVTRADEVNQDATLNSLKDLLIVAYRNMTQEEVQSRYYYGLTPIEQQVFQQRWNNFSTWFNQVQEQYRQQQQEEQAQEKNSGGFWKALGIIVLSVVAGYAAYRASTYNSQINSQVSNIQYQNTQMQAQMNDIQADLRRLAY